MGDALDIVGQRRARPDVEIVSCWQACRLCDR
jgi:hypothetical protein